jgi:hypothetical protein
MKLNTISLTCIWTKNKIFNVVHVTYAEYSTYRCARQLITSLSTRCQFDSTYIFSVFLVGLFGNYITRRHKHRLGWGTLPFALVCSMVASALNMTISQRE